MVQAPEAVERVRRALAQAGSEAEVRTGFSMGGVAPIGHLGNLPVLIDEDLLRYDVVWAAAGSQTHVFRTSADELVRLTGGRLAAARQD